MVFGEVTSDDNVITPFIFFERLWLKMEAHVKYLDKVMLPSIETVAARRPYLWQKDSAICHTIKRSQSWPWENFCDHIIPNIWLPNTSDFNPLDYYAWGTVKSETYTILWWTEGNDNGSVYDLSNEIVGKACMRFWSHLVPWSKWMAIYLNTFNHHLHVTPPTWISLTLSHHPSLSSIKATFCVGTKAVLCRFCWSSCLCSLMWKGSHEYVAYEIVPTFPAVSVCLVRLNG